MYNFTHFLTQTSQKQYFSILSYLDNLLAWEPSAAQVSHSYSRRLPALERFYRETKFLLLKSTHSTKNLKTKLRTFPLVSRVPQSKFETNRSRGCRVMIEQTNKQTVKQRLQLYI